MQIIVWLWSVGSCGLVWRLIGGGVGGECVADGEVALVVIGDC